MNQTIQDAPTPDRDLSPQEYEAACAAVGMEVAAAFKTLLLDVPEAELSLDAEGHEHKGKGTGGGQFVSKGGGGGGDKSGSELVSSVKKNVWESPLGITAAQVAKKNKIPLQDANNLLKELTDDGRVESREGKYYARLNTSIKPVKKLDGSRTRQESINHLASAQEVLGWNFSYVVGNLTDKALSIASCMNHIQHKTDDAMKEAYGQDIGKANSYETSSPVIGFYDPGKVSVNLSHRVKDIKGVWSHEVGHGLDFSEGMPPISKSEEWQSAWKSEIVSLGSVSNQAKVNAAEGFAEVVRAIVDGGETLAKLRATSPKCYEVMKKHGFAP